MGPAEAVRSELLGASLAQVSDHNHMQRDYTVEARWWTVVDDGERWLGLHVARVQARAPRFVGLDGSLTLSRKKVGAIERHFDLDLYLGDSRVRDYGALAGHGYEEQQP